jgi:hypothetical protein
MDQISRMNCGGEGTRFILLSGTAAHRILEMIEELGVVRSILHRGVSQDWGYHASATILGSLTTDEGVANHAVQEMTGQRCELKVDSVAISSWAVQSHWFTSRSKPHLFSAEEGSPNSSP